MSLGGVVWTHPSKRFTVPENMLCKALMHDAAQITKRVHEAMGRRLAFIFNKALDAQDAQVLVVMEGQTVWQEANAGVCKNATTRPSCRLKKTYVWPNTMTVSRGPRCFFRRRPDVR